MSAFTANSAPADVFEALSDAGVQPSTANDFIGFRKLAAKTDHPSVAAEYAAKRDALIERFPILADFDQFLTSIGK